MPSRCTMLPVRGNQGEPTRPDCEPRITNVGSGAMNVGRRPRRESMMVGSYAILVRGSGVGEYRGIIRNYEP
jgi:hypothetical protein